MVEGGMKCIKYLLFIFNFIFVLAAIALIVCGALVQTEFKAYFNVFGEQFNAAAILLIVVGCIIFFIAAFGCFGAVQENYICTMVFAGLLATIFILEIAGGIAGFVLRDKIEAVVSGQLHKDIHNYYTNNATRNMFDTIQEKFDCCGVTNVTDWTDSSNFTRYGYPASCCAKPNCNHFNQNEQWDKSCMNSFVEWAEDNIYKIGAAGIALAVIQIIGIIFACCLARSIRKEYEVV